MDFFFSAMAKWWARPLFFQMPFSSNAIRSGSTTKWSNKFAGKVKKKTSFSLILFFGNFRGFLKVSFILYSRLNLIHFQYDAAFAREMWLTVWTMAILRVQIIWFFKLFMVSHFLTASIQKHLKTSLHRLTKMNSNFQRTLKTWKLKMLNGILWTLKYLISCSNYDGQSIQ